MSEGVIIDASEFYKLADDLDVNGKEMSRAIKSGFRKSANIITRQAKQNLKSVYYSGKKLNNIDLLNKGVNIAIWKKGNGATVGLIDNLKSTIKYKGGEYRNPAYLLRWINQGTRERYTKQGIGGGNKFRGMMMPRPFFDEAINQAKDRAEETLTENINNAIKRIAAKKK